MPLLYTVLKMALSSNPNQLQSSHTITGLDDFLRYDKDEELLREHYVDVYKTVEMIARLYVQ